VNRALLIERLDSLGAALLYAPELVGDPLVNLGSLALPNGELKNGAALVAPGLVDSGAAVALDGTNDYIDAKWRTRTNQAKNPVAFSNLTEWSGESLTAGPTRVTGLGGMPTELSDGQITTAIEAAGNAASDRIYTPVAPVIGKTYRGSVWVKLLSSTATGIKLTIRRAALGEVQMSSPNLTKVGEWVRLDFTWTAVNIEAQRLCVEQVGAGAVTFQATAFLFEETSELGSYFPTVKQVVSGEASFSGTLNASESDIGPFARGSTRTWLGFAKRDASANEDALFGGNATSTIPSLALHSGNQTVDFFSANSSLASWANAWPGNAKKVFWALVFNEVANTAELFINGISKGVVAQTDAYNAPGGLIIGARRNDALGPFDGTQIPFAAFLRGLSAEEIASVIAQVGAPRVVSEPVDDRLLWELGHADGGTTRWAGDAPDASGIPQGGKLSNSAPGGHRTASLTLLRDPRQDWPDLELVDEIKAYGRTKPLGRNAFEGQTAHFPSELGDGVSIGVNAVGNQVLLDEDETWKALYVALGFEGWGEAPLARRQFLASGGGLQQRIPLSTTNGGLVWDPPTGASLSVFEETDAIYSAPAGLPIRKVGYRGTRKGDWSNFESPALWHAINEELKEASFNSLTLDNTARTTELATARRYLMLRAIVTVAHSPAAGVQQSFDRLAVYGDHGLPLIDWKPGVELFGVYAHDVLGHMLSSAAPELKYRIAGDGTIIPNTNFVIPHLAFPEAGKVSEAILKLNAYFLNNFGVWDDKEFHWRPWDPTRLTWKCKIQGGAHWAPAGRQALGLLNGIVVEYNDVQGRRRTVGPPESECDFESELLRVNDPSNPYTARGRRRWGVLQVDLPLAFDSTAVQVGYVKLLEQQRPQRSGTLEVRPLGPGHIPQVEHPTAGPMPVWAMRAGDYAELDGWPEPEPFRVIEAEYDETTKTLRAQLDTASSRLSAIMERVGVRMIGVM